MRDVALADRAEVAESHHAHAFPFLVEEVLAKGRAGVDDKYVLPILGVHVDKSDSRLKRYTGPTKVHNWTDMTKNLRTFMTNYIKGASGQHQQTEDDAASSCPAFPYVLCLEAFDRTVEDVLASSLGSVGRLGLVLAAPAGRDLAQCAQRRPLQLTDALA